MTGASYEDAEAATAILATDISHHPELRGIGIAVLDDGFGVKVNLSCPVAWTVPDRVNGVPVVVQIVGTVRPL